jgi:hypothetical protein
MKADRLFLLVCDEKSRKGHDSNPARLSTKVLRGGEKGREKKK